MTKKQKHILFLLAGIFLLSTTIFREELFTQSHFGLGVYRGTAITGLLLMALSIGHLINKKWKWVLVASLFLIETCFASLFHLVKNGTEMPEKITNLLSYIYLFHCRDYVVYDKERGQYDPDLFYKLKPGEFNYSNMEFSTKFHVNSAGFRDDENSLNNPDIVFLGDSYTMGWGVEQEETYVNILEKKLNKNILNLGIASYGTAREYLAFENIKHDSCELIVLQFCPNDVVENKSFVENNFQLNISPKEKFDKEIIWNKIYKVYFPLKYVHSFIFFLVKKIIPKKQKTKTVSDEIKDGIAQQDVEYFFVILQKIKNSFNGQIIIFNLGMNITTPSINNQLKKWLSENKMEGVYVFPSTEHLTKDDYLPLDTHLKVSGNKKLAEGLEGFILKNNLIKH